MGKASIQVMQFSQVFFTYFYLHLLITSLIQNSTRFSKAFINIDARTTEQLYEQNARNVVASNGNNNIDKPYSICNLCKMTEREYGSYKMINEVFMPIMLIAISHQEKLQ